ncbi:MAG: tail fiber protein [Bacilli bacterium]|nr:tail fiber protein [bacterium]MBR2890982.1 tail fiber protein [Bacilli bacterium]MBR3890287.1 tail fiber protein [bacterium]
MTAASTSAAGAVQLNNTLTSTSTTQALTAAQGKELYDNKARAYYGSSAPSSSTGKNGDIYFLIS